MWSAPIDNSDFTPAETLRELARRVDAGDGRLRRPFGPHHPSAG
jgi:hypothetical protein